MQRLGDAAAFLSAGGCRHHIGLNTRESAGARPPPPGHTGLYRTAFPFPDRASLGAVPKRVVTADIPIDGAADPGVSEAVYLRGSDLNGVELYRDRSPGEWPRDAEGRLAMFSARLDLAALMAEAT